MKMTTSSKISDFQTFIRLRNYSTNLVFYHEKYGTLKKHLHAYTSKGE